MKVWSIILVVVCLNLGAFSIHAMGLFPVSRELWVGPDDVTSTFSIELFAVMGTGGVIIGILGAIFRTYTFAVSAIVIWVVTILIEPLRWILGGLPIMLSAVLPTGISWFTTVVGSLFGCLFFAFIVEILTQREIT